MPSWRCSAREPRASMRPAKPAALATSWGGRGVIDFSGRFSACSRTADLLSNASPTRSWRRWPAGNGRNGCLQERSLAQSLGISRNTLRAALVRLRKRGVGQAYPRPGLSGHHQSQGNRKKTAAKITRCVILSPEPLAWLRPALGMLIDELRVLLLQGQRLRSGVHNGRHYYRSGSPQLLRKLVSSIPPSAGY